MYLSVPLCMITSSSVFILATVFGVLKFLTRSNYRSKFPRNYVTKVLPIISDTLRSFGSIQSKEGSFYSYSSDE